MNNLRTYGSAPFRVALIHGGPGAPGGMAPVARALSTDRGVLEPLQTADSLKGQVQELRSVITINGDPPLTLVGFSWGAMLAFILTARYPSLVRKLILVGSGVYQDEYAKQIKATRLKRLSDEERRRAHNLMDALEDPHIEDKNTPFAQLGKLITKADAYNPSTLDTEELEVQYHINQSVWRDAAALRKSGELLKLGERIRCPVVAIHGDFDPHPSQGVREPLSSVLGDFRFILLERCGHIPWIEREAKETFYEVLRVELDE